ncbi:LytTR family DNA-binding domain-containing protein [Algoriphagus halophytocola]|uniref:LytTR family DNA-binding domain-containing protein n=1 Tax=Algoriphagus halophytocola TaxID=2991499 RepID=A0ABY6MG85_9BACT|nr:MULTISPECIES: LytTR family DNA-binding domain-containing protein [unclassified Algoriphagus]UZD21442.1 LytTR family DNA-binding domain-containing protein [Algoriphagus sp. TR-M5]WBL42654.1 LytTR family DNA-binding domain-containing protein [Algoriphagus sp. TR-M9]
MRILIIEDEKPAFNLLLKKIKPYFPTAEIFGNLDTVKSSVAWLRENPVPDLIFCDIQLADGISFEIFENVRLSTPIIFTTAFDQYAIKAFQVNAIDYLLKPIDPEDLQRAVDKFKAKEIRSTIELDMLKSLLSPPNKSYKSRFLVRFGEKIQSIAIAEISHFFSEERVTFLQTVAGKKFVLEGTLEQTESQLNPDDFFRINRRYLVSAHAIQEIFSYSNSRLKVTLKNCEDQDILISREKVSEFKSWLDR